MSLIDRIRTLKTRAADRLMPQRLVYHHVPKCGGTSVGRALRLRYLLSQGSILTEPALRSTQNLYPGADLREQWTRTIRFREAMLLYLMHCDVRCIAAHVAFSRVAWETFREQYVFVTLLRDPVERYLSHYRHSLAHTDYSHTDLPLEAFVETVQAQSFGTRYVQYFRGEPSVDDLDSRAAIESAKQNLDHFSVVGFIDRMPAFAEQLRSTLKVHVRIGHENRGRIADEPLAPPGSAVRRRIEDQCAPDLEVYTHARRRFG